MSIQRYEWDQFDGPEPVDDGQFVLYSDHVAELDHQRDEMKVHGQPCTESYDVGFEDGREQGHREANELLYRKGVADERKRIREAVKTLTVDPGQGWYAQSVLDFIDGSETDE